VLCNCELLTFGFDLSSASGMDVTVEAMIDLRPTKSLALQMQKWGRALRKKKTPALIFDHAGNVSEHGFPDDPREWSLQGSRKKNLAFKAAGSMVKNCNGGWENRDLTGKKMEPCYFSHRPAPRCLGCGAWYEVDTKMIQTLRGELSESERPARRALTMEEVKLMEEMVADMTKRGVNAGKSEFIARKWAIGKAQTWMESRIDKAEEAGLSITMHAGDKELPMES